MPKSKEVLDSDDDISSSEEVTTKKKTTKRPSKAAPPTKKRKSEAEEKDEENGDEDQVKEEDKENEEEEEVEEKPKGKQAKTSKGKASQNQTNDSKDGMYQLSNNRFVNVSEFKGKALVNIREYYESNGKFLPGKKGISLTAEQWDAFKKVVGKIDNDIKNLK